MNALVLGLALVASFPVPQERSRDLILARSDAPAGLPIYTGSHLLIVGIDRYEHLPQGAQLRYAVNDAQEFRKVLQEYYAFQPKDTKILTNGQASLSNIRKVLDEMADPSKVKPDDRVLVYFSGHGQSVRDSAGIERGYLVPADAKISLDQPDPAQFAATCLPMQEVWDRLDPSPAKHITVLADACFSGLLTKSKGFEGFGLSAYLTMPARQAVTAGGSGQKTWESDEYKHGVFTYSLIQELKRRARDKQQVFPIVELFASVLDPVVRLSKGRQTPQYNPFFTEGQMLFFAAGEKVPDDEPVVQPQAFATKLTIRSDPLGADAWIDDEPVGKTPVERNYSLSEPKQVRIRLEREGYKPAERELQIKPRADAKVNLKLEKQPTTNKVAKLFIKSDPPGATVTIDGQTAGITPLTLTRDLALPKSVIVRFSKEGYTPKEERLTLDPKKAVQLEVTLVKVAVPPSSPLRLLPITTLKPPGPIAEVSFSPDGKRAVVYGDNGAISFFELPSGRLERTVTKPKDTFVRLSQDWKSIAFVTLMSDGVKNWASLLLQDLKNDASGKVLSAGLPECVLMNHAWMDRQNAIVCGQTSQGAGVLTILNLQTGKTLSFSAPGRFTSATASPDGETVAVFRDARRTDVAVNLILIRGKDWSDQQQISITDSDFGEGLFFGSGAVAVNSGRRVNESSFMSRGFRVYDTKTGSLRFASPRHEAIGFLDNGKRLAGWTSDGGGRIEVFDTGTGKSLGEAPSTRPWLSEDGSLCASVAADQSVIVASVKQIASE